MRDYRVYLKDIADAMASIERFVEGLSFEDFVEDDKTFSAVIRKFEIIGEATRSIPDAVRDRHPDIPWKKMAGMRDVLIHFYAGVEPGIVWDTIKSDIPKVKPLVEKAMEEER